MKPSEIENLPLRLQGIYNDMQLNIMIDIIRRIKKAGQITETADYLINRQIYLGGSMEYVRKEIQKALKLSDKEIDRMFKEAITKDYTENKKLYKGIGKEFIPYEKNEVLQQQIEVIKRQTKGELRNISASLGFALKGSDGKIFIQPIANYYQTNLDKAIVNIITGSMSYDQAIKQSVAEMVNSGIRMVDYQSGWHNRIAVATRRAVMTGITQATAEINKYNMETLGTDLVEVSWHSGARSDGIGYVNHASWQGKVYTMKQLVDICGYGLGGGIGGWNCRHTFSPFIQGISKPLYTKAELIKLNTKERIKREYEGTEYNTYQALQRQRQLETELRRQRSIIELLKKGGASENTITGARIKYRDTTKQYKDFSKDMRLPEQKARIYVDNLGMV